MGLGHRRLHWRSRGLSGAYRWGHDGREGWAADSPAGGAAHAAQEADAGRGRNAVGYPARAPSASAMCRHASRCGVERGRCRTTRRTERIDVDPQLQQPVPQPRHLAAGARGTRRPQSQFLHEHVGGGSQEDAQLVRPEQTAARAVDLQPIEQFLDPILDVPASTVDLLIDEARRLLADSSPRTAGCPAARGPRGGRLQP